MISSERSLAVSFDSCLESDFPLGMRRPKWLQSFYNADYWVSTGQKPENTYKIFFNALMSDGSLLTDAPHFHLLDTVRRMSIGLRTGPFATVTEPDVQMAMTNAMVTWILWMDLNGVRAFSKLTRGDFDAYVERAVYGTSYLLELPARIRNHIANLRSKGVALPMKGKWLDVRGLFKEANIDGARAVHDRFALYEVFKAAQEEGIHLKLNQMSILKAGPSNPSRVSKIHLLRLLQPWEYQWQMRRTLPGDKITFDPFPSCSIGEITKKLGVRSRKSKTPPVYQSMFLIDRSIRWILDYAPSILLMIDRFDAVALRNKHASNRKRLKAFKEILVDSPLPLGPGQPGPIKPRIITLENETSGISDLLHCLFASCFVVIAAFTARRRREVTSCREKGPENDYCITTDEYGSWIELWVEKTVQGWDKTPCPEVVVKAVEVLRKLSKSGREISGTLQLFQYKVWGSNEVASVYILRVLAKLISHLDIPPLVDGSKWNFEPRQFRRFFAIMYVWRYEFGELSALSYQLRHYNLDMTRRYITESTQGKIFRDTQTEHAVSMLKEVALGRRAGGGPFGERFKKIAKRIRDQMISTVHVFSEEKFSERIERLVVRAGKVLKGFPWGYCACGASARDLAQARCLEGQNLAQAAGPDQANATLLTCATCPHHFTHAAFAPYTAGQIELHEKAAADKKNGHLIRNASAAYLPRLREYYDRAFCQSKPVRSSHAK